MCLEVEQHLQTTTTTPPPTQDEEQIIVKQEPKDEELIIVKEEPKDEDVLIKDENMDEYNFGELVVDSSESDDDVFVEADQKEHTLEELIEDPVVKEDQPKSPSIDQLGLEAVPSQVVGSEPAELKQCSICQKGFKDLWKHIYKEHREGDGTVCPICKNDYFTSVNLRTHLVVHTGERPYACTFCPKTYKQSGILKMHLKRDHNSNQCEANGQAQWKKGKYATVVEMRTRDSASRDIVECPVCKETMKFCELHSHFVRHTAEEPYECSYCKAAFPEEGNARLHCEIVHYNSAVARVVLKKGSIFESKRPWEAMGYTVVDPVSARSCAVCDKKFFCPLTLIHHSLVHTREKPFRCQYCNRRAFKCLKQVRNHITKQHPNEDATRGVLIAQDTAFARQYNEEIRIKSKHREKVSKM